MSNLFVRLWLLLLVALLLNACASRPQPSATVLPPVSEEQLLTWLAKSGERYASLATLAKTRVTTPERTVSFRQALLVAVPDRLRAEVLSPFGLPLLQLAAADGMLQVYIPAESRFLAGAATAENLANFTRIPISLEELTGLLLQRFPGDARARGKAETLADVYQLTFADAGASGIEQRFTFAPNGRLLGVVQLRGGNPEFTAVYKPAASEDAFPAGLSIRWPAAGVELSMDFDESDTTTTLPRERFVLHPPDGVTVLPLP